ncbi:hypothetical protein Tco_1110097 [Tanacetum coccineum]|uniref:Retrovirus-related Pol polyprotein from transposon TNT 1-94-like beta-barrel domain-containing protein n=1 Tax=Tanacetum coccineum TaxID=301880 RepID=A0ABQ5IKD2_9ASTR
MLLMQAQENRVDLDEEQLLFLTGGQTHTFDDEVDEGPVQDMAQNEDNIFQVYQCDAFDSDVDEAPTAQTMFMANLSSADPVYDEAGLSYDSDTLSEDNKDQVVHNDVSSVPNDVVMIITNNIYEHDAPCVTSNNTVNVSLTAELARYKELVEVKDKLYKQDQSLQTVNMLCKPKSFYDEVNWVAIGYKNLFYLSKAKQVQPALYNGHEIVKTNHACALVHDSEDTLEIPKTTRKQMIEKMKDLECVKKKAKALKEKAKSTKPTTAMTVYPPNTPPKLFPKVLPTKRERGFEQTKTCYLTEVIPFFKTIKEHFEGIQPALVNEIKEMKEVFDQMEVEVDQHALIRNYVLTVSIFSDMRDAYTAALKHIAELEAENSNLIQKIQKDDQDEMIKHFSKLEAEHLNLQLKYQHLKERFGNKKSVTSSDAPAFESNKDLNEKVNTLQDLNEHFRVENEKVKQHYKELYDSIKLTRAKTIENTTSLLTKIETLKAQIKGKMKCVTMADPVKPKVFAPGMYAIDVEPIPPCNRNNKEVHLEYLKHLKESVGTLREIVKEAMELLKYVTGTYPKDINKRDRKIATASLNRKKQVTFVELGVKYTTAASGSKPRRNTKKDRTLPAKSDKKKVIQIVLWYLNSGCSKHMTGDRSWLRNFMKKFIGIVRFGNDHFCAIMGYGDYMIGDSVISRVYYVEGLGHNLFSVVQFCNSDLEVAFRKHSCYVRDVNGVDLIKGSHGTNLYTISVEDI